MISPGGTDTPIWNSCPDDSGEHTGAFLGDGNCRQPGSIRRRPTTHESLVPATGRAVIKLRSATDPQDPAESPHPGYPFSVFPGFFRADPVHRMPCAPVRTPGARRCHFKYGRCVYILLERCDSNPGVPAASMTNRWCRTVTRRPILTNLSRQAARTRPARTVCGRVALRSDCAQRTSVTKPQAGTVSRTGASRSSRRWLAANAVLNAASWPVCRLIQLTTVWS